MGVGVVCVCVQEQLGAPNCRAGGFGVVQQKGSKIGGR